MQTTITVSNITVSPQSQQRTEYVLRAGQTTKY